MADGPAQDPDARARREEDPAGEHRRAAELRAAAAARAEELRASAAAKGSEFAQSAAARRSELASRGAEVRRQMRQMDVPWARCGLARFTRETILQFGLGPVIDLYTRARVTGREHFEELPHPVILVANHASHLDTPTILRALPRRFRQRTAVAAAADYFYKSRAVANAVALVFNTVPILRRGGGMGDGSFDHVDRLLQQRWNLLIYAEGTRSRRGQLGRLRSGAAVIARRHGIPIIPVYVKGTYDAMPPGRGWPRRAKGMLPIGRRHRVEVVFGAPVLLGEGDDHSAVMERLRPFLSGEGAVRTAPAREDGTLSAVSSRRPVTPAL